MSLQDSVREDHRRIDGLQAQVERNTGLLERTQALIRTLQGRAEQTLESVRASWSGAQALPANTWTAPAGPWVQSWQQPGGQFNLANGLLTAQDGLYLFVVAASFAANVTGSRGVEVRSLTAGSVLASIGPPAAAGNSTTLQAPGLARATLGEVFELRAYQNGTTVNLTAANFSAVRLGP